MKINHIFGGRGDRKAHYEAQKAAEGGFICRICEWRGSGDPCDACLKLEDALMDDCDKRARETQAWQEQHYSTTPTPPPDRDVQDELVLGRGSWESDKPAGESFGHDKPPIRLPEGW